MADLSGKSAIVTGGAQGIGKAICQALLEENVKVCVGDIDVEQGEATVKEFGAKYGVESVIFEKLNVADEIEFENVMKRAKEHFGGHLDILINNAGILQEFDWKRMMQVNLFGVGNGIELAHRYLCDSKGEKGGTVINTASIVGILTLPMIPFYSASKCGVVGLTLTFGHETHFKRTNVKVSAVCPDLVDTQIFTPGGVELSDVNARRLIELKEMGEILQPVDIARGVIKLLRDDLSRAVLVVSRTKGAYYYPLPYIEHFLESDKI